MISLVVFTARHHFASTYLRSGDFQAVAGLDRPPMHSATYLIAFVVMAIGVDAFLTVLARL